MKVIKIKKEVGIFAGNKDLAKEIRVNIIIPSIKVEDIVIDFEGVEGTTQSFVHALISDVIRKEGIEVIDKMFFKNCNNNIKQIIEIVIDYMQESSQD